MSDVDWNVPSFLSSLVTAYENSSQHDPSSNNAMLGVHASASTIIQYGRIAWKQGLVNVALDILSRIHTIPTVPIVDCFQKIRQQVKCYLQLAGVMGKKRVYAGRVPGGPSARPCLAVRSLGQLLAQTTGKGTGLLQDSWSQGAVLPERERDRKPLEYLNYMPRSLICHILG